MWLSSSREIWSQTRCAILPISSLLAMLVKIPVLLTRCAILPISSLLAMLVTIPILLTRLFGQISCNYWSKSFRKCGLDQKSLLYVDLIMDLSTGTLVSRAKSLVNKAGIVTSIAKSDEISKIAHLACARLCVRCP